MSHVTTRDVRERILARCIDRPDTDCIEWTGYKLQSGYGTISWGGRDWVVHRAMWTVDVGPIPEGDEWTIDHLCYNRACVNVKHLEVVTRTENSRRAGGLLRAQSANKARLAMRCKNGHPRDGSRDHRGNLLCHECRRLAWARRSDRVNAARRSARGRVS